MSGVDIFVATSDANSLISLFGITNSYSNEANLIFDNKGFGLSFFTADDQAMIVFQSLEEQLLAYQFLGEEKKYIGVSLKKCYTTLRSVAGKSVTQIYKMIDDDDALYIKPESTLSKDGADCIRTIDLEIDTRESPDIDPDDKYVKLSTSDFSSLCGSLNKQECKTIKFTILDGTLIIKGYNAGKKCASARSFKYNSIDTDDSNGDNYVDDEEDEDPTPIKRGKFSIIVKKNKNKKNDCSVFTTIDKLKPLNKINNLCKNGIIYVYVSTSKKMIILKTKVGQIGTLKIYLRDANES